MFVEKMNEMKDANNMQNDTKVNHSVAEYPYAYS